jgi:4-hydroxy-tetrahydrodipicolinate synthase
MSFNNIITVIPTFFDNNNNIDFNGINNHIEKQIEMGIKTIIILGTTSETPTLTKNEKLFIVNSVYKKFNSKLKIIIGISGNETTSVIDECNNYSLYGDGYMISAPYYNKPSQEGLYQHFQKIITSTSKNIILYNVPSRCGVNIEPETIARIHNNFPQVVAIKEASGSIEQVIKIKTLSSINIYSGDDGLTLPFMSIGAIGVISVVSNICPEEIIKMVDEFSKGNISNATIIFYNINPLIKLAFIESNPVPIKYLINKFNNNLSEQVRLPLVELTNSNKLIINNWLNKNTEFKIKDFK